EHDVEVVSSNESIKTPPEKETDLSSSIVIDEASEGNFITPSKRPIEDAITCGIDEGTSSAQHSTNKRKAVIKIEKEDKGNKE
ncbi:hypothetical protein SOVF_206900, partial [Spinacia oleracea]